MKRTSKKQKTEPKPFAGVRCFKGLSFGDGTALVDALRRFAAEKLAERQRKAAGKPN